MKVVAFGGLATAGKTTAANLMANLIYERELGIPRLRSFAGPLKEAAKTLGASKEGKPDLYRKFCQKVGTEMMRNPEFVPGVTGEDYWVNLINDMMQENQDFEFESSDKETIMIFDDVRFENEIELIRRWGGIMIFVDATARGVLVESGEDNWKAHESEMVAIKSTLDAEYRRKHFDEVLSASTMESMTNRINLRTPFWIKRTVSHDDSID